MSGRPTILHPADWSTIRLVVFDIDGTLYDQRALRARMAREMMIHAVRTRDVRVFPIVNAYRRLRENVARTEACYSEPIIVDKTADCTGFPQTVVRATIEEWIEERPLTHLADCRYAGVLDVFAGLKKRGVLVGVLSDYPARAKLTVLGLTADYIVTAGDEGVGFFYRDTRGLARLVAAAGVPIDTAIVIGDRKDRDGLVARRMGMRALIRSARPIRDWQTFSNYEAPLFGPVSSAAVPTAHGAA